MQFAYRVKIQDLEVENAVYRRTTTYSNIYM